MNNQIKLVFLVLVVFLLMGSWYFFNQQEMTISVLGEGSVVVPAGKVSMIVTSASMGNTAGDAITSGEATMAKMIDYSKKMMGPDAELRKSFYQVTPQGDGKYVMANAMSVKSSNVGKTGELIRFLYATGANTVSGVTFLPQDSELAEKQVWEAAINNAKSKASNIASSMGKKLGKLISITDDGGALGGTVSDNTTTDSNFNTVRIEKKITAVYEVR
jgi:uncharacterized protein YggE